ncbi:LysR family transcriptional regulator [Jatrophihabitans fulvus]
MELRQLRYLVAIADERSFTAAAARELVAQPAISAQIAGLEREVGQRLFERTPRGAVPTAAGDELVRRARSVLAQVDDARDAMAELAGLVRGEVTVATVRGAPLGRLASLLGGFRRDHPGVRLRLREGESDGLVDALTAGTVDLAVVGLAGAAPAGLDTHPLLEAPVHAYVSADHRWHGRRTVALADVTAQPLVTLSSGTGVRSAFDAACRDRGLDPEIAFEVGTVAAAVDLAREGLGVAVLPGEPGDGASVVRGLHAIPIVRPVVRSRLALAWSRDAERGRPAVRGLVAAARRHYGIVRPRS